MSDTTGLQDGMLSHYQMQARASDRPYMKFKAQYTPKPLVLIPPPNARK